MPRVRSIIIYVAYGFYGFDDFYGFYDFYGISLRKAFVYESGEMPHALVWADVTMM